MPAFETTLMKHHFLKNKNKILILKFKMILLIKFLIVRPAFLIFCAVGKHFITLCKLLVELKLSFSFFLKII